PPARPPSSILLPYTTLFRSKVTAWNAAQTAERNRLQQQYPHDEDARRRGLEAWLKANPEPRATVADAADHIDHIKKVAGIDHIGDRKSTRLNSSHVKISSAV